MYIVGFGKWESETHAPGNPNDSEQSKEGWIRKIVLVSGASKAWTGYEIGASVMKIKRFA